MRGQGLIFPSLICEPIDLGFWPRSMRYENTAIFGGSCRNNSNGQLGFFDIGRWLRAEDIGKNFCLAAPTRYPRVYDWSFVGADDAVKLVEITDCYFKFVILGGGLRDLSIKLERELYDQPRWVTPKKYEDKIQNAEYEKKLESIRSLFPDSDSIIVDDFGKWNIEPVDRFIEWYEEKIVGSDAPLVFRAFEIPKKILVSQDIFTPNLNSDNPYEVLGVSENCSKSVIKKRYFELARSFHPDKNPNSSKETAEFFKKIQNAYETIIKKSDRVSVDWYPAYRKDESFIIVSRKYNILIKQIHQSFQVNQHIKDSLDEIVKIIRFYSPFEESESDWLKLESVSHSYLACFHIQQELETITFASETPKEADIQEYLDRLKGLRKSEYFETLDQFKEKTPEIYLVGYTIFYDKQIALLRTLCELKLKEGDEEGVKLIFEEVHGIKDNDIVPLRDEVNRLIRRKLFTRIKESFENFANNFTSSKPDQSDFNFKDKSSVSDDMNTKKKKAAESSQEVGIPKRKKAKRDVLTRAEVFSQIEDNLNSNLNYFNSRKSFREDLTLVFGMSGGLFL